MILTIICTENYTNILKIYIYTFKLQTYKYILPELVAGLTGNYYY